MKFLTINVHGWQEDHPLQKMKQLARVIHKNNYDGIALQEVSQHREAELVDDHIRLDNYGLLLNNELAKLGSTDYELFWDISHYGFEVYEEGLALLVRHPLEKITSFYITDSVSIHHYKSRKIVGGTWNINGQSISLYTCHLGWWDDPAENYQTKVDHLIERTNTGDHPLLLLGDFNAPDNVKNEGYDYLLSKGLYDTHTRADQRYGKSTIAGNIDGWAHNESQLKVDHIFANWKADVKESRIVFDGVHEPIISDHFGIEITLNEFDNDNNINEE